VLPEIAPFNFGKDEVNFDDSITATCSVIIGDLPISFWWTLSDSFESFVEYNISTNDGIEISKAGKKLSFLNIEAVKARHRGNYTCYAKNKAGTAKHSAFLAINGYCQFYFLFSLLKFLANVAIQVLPHIVPFNFGEEEINFDDSITATCSVIKGDLPMKIWWSLSESIESISEYNISTNDGIVISKAGNKLSVLNIEAVKARHRGNYTCYAANKAGINKHSAYLAVNG
jgi:Immunoglobulin domain